MTGNFNSSLTLFNSEETSTEEYNNFHKESNLIHFMEGLPENSHWLMDTFTLKNALSLTAAEMQYSLQKKWQDMSFDELLNMTTLGNSIRLACSRSLAFAADLDQKIQSFNLIIRYLTILGIAYFAIRTFVSLGHLIQALWQGEDPLTVLRTHGLDAMSNALWTTALILPFVVASTIAAPITLIGFASDIAMTRTRLCEKEIALDKECQALSHENKDQCPSINNAVEGLRHHYQKSRQMNTVMATTFFVNASLLTATQACAYLAIFTGTTALAATVLPLTITFLGIAATVTLGYLAYRYFYENPQEERLKAALVAAKNGQSNQETAQASLANAKNKIKEESSTPWDRLSNLCKKTFSM